MEDTQLTMNMILKFFCLFCMVMLWMPHASLPRAVSEKYMVKRDSNDLAPGGSAQQNLSDGSAQDTDDDESAQNTADDGSGQDADSDGSAQNTGDDGSAQDTVSDGSAQDTDSDGFAQGTDSDGSAQGTDSVGSAQGTDSDGSAQGTDSDGSAQGTDSVGSAQDAEKGTVPVESSCDIRTIISGQEFSDFDKLAEAADRVWEARSLGIQHITQTTNETTPDCVESIQRNRPLNPRRNGSSTAPSPAPVCFYHTRFSPGARKCLPGCKFASLLSGTTQPYANRGSSCSLQSNSNTLSVEDRKSGLSNLVDRGADVSVYPASAQDRRTLQPSNTLSAANGTTIRTWEKRTVS
ncbi:retrovirus-related Pol polyprotein [Elysia marginata]|uniref:Retrovirus-related Pol polyprotein n=1 Tax=Elysia marginata TaxID=1093978 RepID=A0AAV4FWN2_9GAST|nr:retrovirus-related Pol polyprotein [Elysia marginata]